MHPTTSGRAAGLLAATFSVLVCCASVHAQALPPVASAPALPAPPHQVTPDAPLHPDYYAAALTHTQVTDDPAWRPLHLTLAPQRPQPAFIVLPVQTQAYGFAPTFRALLGARLDQELQRRHVDASRQTEIVDWRGPFVRRSDDATVDAFAAEHRGATLLTLYAGHDGDGHAFLTLSRNDEGKLRLATRHLDIPDGSVTAFNALGAAVPPLLAELGLGNAQPAPPLPTGRSGGCTASDWLLADLAREADPVATACHALLMGTLMPDYLSLVSEGALPSAPDRAAWLARAWIEADALASTMPDMRSVATLAAFQLRLDDAKRTVAALVDDRDAAVRPLARMLWAGERATAAPRRSNHDVDDDSYFSDAFAGLPAFATAVAHEHAAFDDDFHRVDLCPIQLALPYFKVPAGCEYEAQDTKPPTVPASFGQRQLLEQWRVAAAWRALYVEGTLRSSASGLAEVLKGLPSQVAAHPFTREMRFAVHSGEQRADGAEAHLAAARSRVLDYAQVIATLQRDDVLVRHFPAIDSSVLASERDDPVLARANDDLQRLQNVESMDFFSAMLWRPLRSPQRPAVFLAQGSFLSAVAAAAASDRRVSRIVPAWPAASGPQHPVAHIATSPMFDTLGVEGLPTRVALEEKLAKDPDDMTSRIELALEALEHGATVAEARRVIDARPAYGRREGAIGESNDWSEAGTMFYFAGELEAARLYYARATKSGSDGDLIARVRLAAIAGDLHGALAESHARAARYQSEWAAADEAGYLFMLGQPAQAWALILPRLQTSTQAGLWRSALAGHRIAGDKLNTLPDWIRRNRLAGVTVEYRAMAPDWLRAYATLDRLPSSADAQFLQQLAPEGKSFLQSSGTTVVKAAIDGQATAAPQTLDRDMMLTSGADRRLLLPFYVWALWNRSAGKDPALDSVRGTPLEEGFQQVLAKAMVLAADGDRSQALRFLTAARYELGRNGGGHEFQDDLRTAAYDFVLATWLMTRQTGEPAYAEQGLAIARAYQHVVEYMAWPYAAESLLSRDLKGRQIAACRAMALDADSMFLHESGLHPDPKSAVCRKATAWQ